MKIALFGYGKMGKEIEKIAISRKHEIVLKVDSKNASTYLAEELKNADVAIDFSTPKTVVENIKDCFEAGVAVVSGTTGWNEKTSEIINLCNEKNQTLFYASNFSIGVNLFFKLNKYAAKLMNQHLNYDVKLEEIHHVHKLDSPSGTAITLANQIIEGLDRKLNWVNNIPENKNELEIISKRIDEVPGTHSVRYLSVQDEITISHQAFSREGFALGAIVAAEWIQGKRGVFSMDDLFKI